MATLSVLNMFSKKIGDVYNSYLTETVPFLAELMEGKLNYELLLFKICTKIYNLLIILRSSWRGWRQSSRTNQRTRKHAWWIIAKSFCLEIKYQINSIKKLIFSLMLLFKFHISKIIYPKKLRFISYIKI